MDGRPRARRVVRLWADLPVRAKGLVVVAIPVLALLGSTLSLHAATRDGAAVQEALERESRKRSLARSLVITLLDAESGIRGYLLTGEDTFLQRYELGRHRTEMVLEQFVSQVAPDPNLREAIATIDTLVHRRIEFLRRLRQTRSTRERHEILVSGHNLSEALRRELDDLILEGNRTVAGIQARARRSERLTTAIVAVGLPLGLLGGLLAMSLFTSGVVRRVKQVERNASRLARGEPLEGRPPGDDELGRVAAAIGEAEELLATRARERDRFFTMSFDMLCIADAEGRFVRLNPAWEETLGWTAEDMTGKPFLSYVHPDDRERTEREAARIAEGVLGLEFDNRYRHRDGSYRWLMWVARADPQSGLLYGAARDITERKRQEHRLEVQALNDDLTELRNRRGFLVLAQQQLRLAERMRQPNALVFIDLDDMKGINDAYGHAEGDRALVDIADILRSTLREADIVARPGGDEFCALLVNCDPAVVTVVTDRVRAAVEHHNRTAGRRYTLSISIGTVQWMPGDDTDVERLIERADRSMYREKAGRASGVR